MDNITELESNISWADFLGIPWWVYICDVILVLSVFITIIIIAHMIIKRKGIGGYSMLCCAYGSVVVGVLPMIMPPGTAEATAYYFQMAASLLMLGAGISAIRFISSLPKNK